MDLIIGGIYRHYKGDYYLVEGIVFHSETGEKLVLYRALYGNCKRYVRPLEMFFSKIDKEKCPAINQEYRFQFQDIKSVAVTYKPKAWKQLIYYSKIKGNFIKKILIHSLFNLSYEFFMFLKKLYRF